MRVRHHHDHARLEFPAIPLHPQYVLERFDLAPGHASMAGVNNWKE
jgi:hypothetical protein